MDEGQNLDRSGGLQGLFHHRRINRVTPFELDLGDLGAGPVGHVGHAAAKGAVDGDHRPVAGLQQVHDGGFHTGRSGGRQGDAGMVRGIEQPGQAPLISSMRDWNCGSRWPMVGRARAARTRGLTSRGPGPIRMRRGGWKLCMIVPVGKSVSGNAAPSPFAKGE